ncbi:LysR family transcriptional regulator [Shewanella sp. WXL01]|uniref:LysR family transcriptional regulator n=1 Tax=Shewanella sp. WXL01 TaxID=2709721 RepID=UPI0014384F82|nr:LysR family transcriptional regulator [Shewanella sp. WXL01]NKF49061.1 LysR family transcriptional regulator [Shewanella sp. WXL01]
MSMSTRTKQLALFLDVVQQGSFSKAAALHDMDNSQLSKQIKKLEADLGVQLLNRSTRSFSLTSAGEEILEQTRLLVENLTQIQNIADGYQSQLQGKIRISAGIFFGQEYIQPVVTKFMQAYPNVQVTLALDDKPTDIISDHFDVTFRMGKLSESNLIARKIANTHFAIFASNSFIERHGEPKTPDELVKLPAVVYSNAHALLNTFCISPTPESDELQDYKMQACYKVNDVRSMMQAVQNGIGYCVVDLFNLDKPISQSGLVPLLTHHKLSTMGTGIYAIYPHRNPTPIVKTFIDAVQEHIGNPPIWVSHVTDYKHMYR